MKQKIGNFFFFLGTKKSWLWLEIFLTDKK